MKKVIVLITAISAVATVITFAVMGVAVYEMDENIIRTTAYVLIPCLVLMFGGLICIRLTARKIKCPHCGKLQQGIGEYCPYCGKKSRRAKADARIPTLRPICF